MAVFGVAVVADLASDKVVSWDDVLSGSTAVFGAAVVEDLVSNKVVS